MTPDNLSTLSMNRVSVVLKRHGAFGADDSTASAVQARRWALNFLRFNNCFNNYCWSRCVAVV